MYWHIQAVSSFVSRFVESHQEKPVFLAATALLGTRTRLMTRMRFYNTYLRHNQKNSFYWASDADGLVSGNW